MKRFISFCIAALWGVLSVWADSVSGTTATLWQGETTTAYIRLTNTNTQYVSFQMDLYLPDGVSLVKDGCSLTSRITDADQELVIGKQSDGAYRLTSTSFSLTPISKTSGNLIKLTLYASGTAASGTARIRNVRLSTNESEKVTLANASFKVNVTEIVDDDRLVYNVISEEPREVEVTYYSTDGATNAAHYTGEITIPEKHLIDGWAYSVTRIGENAFHGCSELTKVTIPESITTLASDCFVGNGLTEVTIPNSVRTVGWRAFPYSGNLQTVTFEEGTTYIGCDAFAESPNLTTVVFPSTLTNTDDMGNIFGGCPNLTEVVLPIGGIGRSHAVLFNGQDLDHKCHFTIPEGSARSYLEKGFYNISDMSELAWMREEFEDEVSRIEAMANDAGCTSTSMAKTALQSSISSARSAVESAENYLAIGEQIEAIKTAAKMFLKSATVSDGVDVTALLRNPSVERTDIGWNIAVESTWQGANAGRMAAEHSNGEVSISNFIEAWWNGVQLGDGSIYQTIKNLPAGIYRLEADAIATWQADESVEVTGATLFAGSETLPIATANYAPQHFSLRFANTTPQDVTIGVKWKETTANWVAADNFRLIYEASLAPAPNGTELVSSETDTLYIYNKEAGMFLNAGNSWGTHAVLAEEGLPVRMTQQADESWRIFFYEGSRSQQLLFSEGDNVWVDYHYSGLPDWTITANGDGTYFIQPQGAASSYLGNDPSRNDYDWQNGTEWNTHVDVLVEETNANNARWQFFTKAQYQVMLAKNTLLETILAAKKAGYDTASEKVVYDDADATLTEVNQAIASLKALFNQDLFDSEPSLKNPVDVTGLIVNPRFENNTTEGWTGANNLSDATQHQTHEFFQKNFDIHQTIYGLQNGLYRLKFKGFNRPGPYETVYNDYIAGRNNVTAKVYANDEQKLLKNICDDMLPEYIGDGRCVNVGDQYIPNTMYSSRLYFNEGLYADYIDVEVTDGVLTIGIRDSQNTDGNDWVIFSDFELYYLLTPEHLHNRILMDDVKGLTKTKMTVPVSLDNEESITGVEFIMTLPEGVTVTQALATSRATGMNLRSSKMENTSSYKILLYGGNKAVTGNSGVLFNLTLSTDETVEAGTYPIEIKDIVLSKASALSIEQEDFELTLTLSEAQKGDVNRDGKVNISDVTSLVNYILDKPTSSFDTKAADVNEDGKINVSDITGIVNLILYGQAVRE